MLLASLPLAQNAFGDWLKNNTWVFIPVAFLVLVGIFISVVFFSFFRLWVQCFFTGTNIGMFELIRMKLRGVDFNMVVRQTIALVKAGVKIGTNDLESHYLARGNVPKTV